MGKKISIPLLWITYPPTSYTGGRNMNIEDNSLFIELHALTSAYILVGTGNNQTHDPFALACLSTQIQVACDNAAPVTDIYALISMHRVRCKEYS